jgi:anti-anti-sigma factor
MVHADSFTASSVSSKWTRWVTLTGEFDMECAPVLSEELDRVAARPTRAVVLDLSGLTFIDCAGLRAVFNFTDRVRALGWRLRIIRPPPHVERIFGLVAHAAAALPERPHLVSTAQA